MNSFPVFSAAHPLIPKRYVPEWQQDMENRRLIRKNCEQARVDTWRGHVSYFLNGRERLSATNHKMTKTVLRYSRNLQPNKSHLSKYNSSLLRSSVYT